MRPYATVYKECTAELIKPQHAIALQAGRLGDQRNYVLPKLNNLNNIENDIKRVQFTAQDICTARVQQSLAKEEACQAAYVAAIAAAFTEKVEAKQRKQAAIKQAKIACEQQKKAAKKAARKEYQRKVTEADASADSCQAEELTRARQLYKDAVLASGTKPQETIQALAAARLEVERRRTEEEQVCSSQEKCMSQLMSLLNTARGTDQVCSLAPETCEVAPQDTVLPQSAAVQGQWECCGGTCVPSAKRHKA